jgi:hypothetical protein
MDDSYSWLTSVGNPTRLLEHAMAVFRSVEVDVERMIRYMENAFNCQDFTSNEEKVTYVR